MNRLTAFFKKLRLRQILTVFFASVLLIASTACSGATTQGANPENPAVQAGGANNPYKGGGGDSYTNLKMSTDPKVTKAKSQGDQTNLELIPQQLVATNKESGLLYPGAETPAGRAEKEAELPIKTAKDFQQPEPGGLNQRKSDLGERGETRLEQVQGTFKEASKFLKEKADEGSQRPEFQSNPALNK